MDDRWHRTIVEESHDALAVLGADGLPRYTNGAMELLLGGPTDPNVPFSTQLHPDDRAAVVESWGALVADGPGQLGRCRVVRADGAYVWVEVAARRTRCAGGELVVVVSLRAGDARRSLEAAVAHDRKVIAALEQLLAPHRTFLTTVGHELRTPLTSILAVAETLQVSGTRMTAGETAKLFGLLVRNARRLRDRVEQFLATDNVDHIPEPDLCPVVLRPFVAGVVSELYAAGADVVIDIREGAVLPIDPVGLADALRALLGNVIGHAGGGSAVRVALEGGPGGSVLVVEDDGPGVPAERRRTVFEPFITFDVPPYRPTVGLGLHLVAQVARAHGGEAWAEETAGGGARLCMRLTGVPALV